MKKLLLTKDSELRSYLIDSDKDYHTQYGVIKKDDFSKGILQSAKGKEFYCFDPLFIDYFEKIKRGAQLVLPKDIATILVESGITSKSIVVDAGTGSGALSSFLAIHAKKVYTFDNRPEHLAVARKTFDFLELKNIVSQELDVYENKVPVKKAHLVTLDLPEPWRAIDNVKDCLIPGGFIMAYSPQITQVQELVKKIDSDNSFILIKIIENIQREWEVKDRITRPKFARVPHTGFITIARRVI